MENYNTEQIKEYLLSADFDTMMLGYELLKNSDLPKNEKSNIMNGADFFLHYRQNACYYWIAYSDASFRLKILNQERWIAPLEW